VEFDVPDGIFGHKTRNARRHNGLTRTILIEGIEAPGQNTDVDKQEEEPRRFKADPELKRGVAMPRKVMTGSAVEKQEDDNRMNRIYSD
jgi:hypothetical protein